jgi:hypothetical protein
MLLIPLDKLALFLFFRFFAFFSSISASEACSLRDLPYANHVIIKCFRLSAFALTAYCVLPSAD